MRSKKRGTGTLKVEVQNISARGFWIWAGGEEHFVDYRHFPWFRSAKVGEICNVKLLHGSHLYWPSLDIDLGVESLRKPEKFPLIAA